jgi:eukaryotic-like serine/threonine-protein kinase
VVDGTSNESDEGARAGEPGADGTPGDGSLRWASGLPGRTVHGRYRIEMVVSVGAFTIITVALDQESNQPVTLKVVRPELVARPDFAEDFARHCEKAAALTHPNIATVLDWGPLELAPDSGTGTSATGTEGVEPTWFWVTEYLAGGSLRDLLDRGRLLEPSQALVVGLEACRALDVAHRRGIVHTEITPSKLVFGEDRRLRVVDFGLAELLGAEAWENPANVPTHVARYASPEQALGMEVDAKTDVYALSLSLIEAVTGIVPFAGDSTMSTLAGRVGKLTRVSADLGSLAAVLERAGRPDSDDRSTAAEFGRGLVQAAETLPRPEPIPLIMAGLFTSTPDRRPSDPTGGVERPVPPRPHIVEAEPAEAEPAGVEPAGAEPSGHAAAGAPVGPGGVVPLVVLTDIADEPDGPAVVRTVEPTRELVIGATEQLPSTSPVPPAASPPVAPVPAADPAAAVYDDEHRPRKGFKIFVGTMMLLVAVGALGFAGWLLVRTKSYEVPDLVGVDEQVALNEISGNGWTVQRELERSDEQPEQGNIVRTVPAAGVKLDEGDTFKLFVSQGPELRTLPELNGLPLVEAQNVLTELRLTPTEGDQAFSEDVALGSVISWTVFNDTALLAGDEVLPDTSIVIIVSKGPMPRATPNLANMTLDEARVALESVQLVVAEGEQVFSSDVEIGRVVAQTPAPDTPVERGGTVTVQVSKGPDLLPFPDLTGQLYTQAQQTLTDAGFGVLSLLGTTEGTFVSATVGGEPAVAGTTYLRGTTFDLVFL